MKDVAEAPRAWHERTASVLNQLAAEGAVVLLPLGSVEQHGPHLPTGVDAILIEAVCRRVAALLNGSMPLVVAPTLWCGLADHHVAFGGTFTLRLPTYHAVLLDLCRSLDAAGFRRIVLVNGHGGNMAALAALTTELTREVGQPVAVTTYFMEALPETAAILTDQAGLMHACEGETSMMMAVRPDLVNAARLPDAHGPAFDIVASLRPSLKLSRPFADVTQSGVSGDARNATAAKGEALIEACAAALARRLLAGEPWQAPAHFEDEAT